MSAIQETLPGTKEMQLAPKSDPMLQIIDLASNPSMDVDKLERLIEMRKDAMRDLAISAFNTSFVALQADIPTVIERSKTDKYHYAALEDIVETVRPFLSKHGFGLSHRTEFLPDGRLKVIGILTHAQGHSRESEFITAPDTGPGRNAIQAQGSANQYARRYTTKDLLNIVTAKEDDDGKKSGTPSEPEGKTEWTDPAGKRLVGYAEWVDLVDAFVLGGCTKKQLDEKWYAAPQSFRVYIATHDRPHVDGWKKKAGK